MAVTKDVPEPPPWIRWPVWVVAAVIVLPLRLLWEGLRAVGRPLLWLWQHLIVLPLRLLGRALQGLGRLLVAADGVAGLARGGRRWPMGARCRLATGRDGDQKRADGFRAEPLTLSDDTGRTVRRFGGEGQVSTVPVVGRA